MKLNKSLINSIQSVIAQSREKSVRSVNHEHVLMYWQMGKVEEQKGQDRATYGNFLIKSLSNQLLPLYGSGFSQHQLNYYRQFYRTLSIINALRAQFSWTHCTTLLPNNSKA